MPTYKPWDTSLNNTNDLQIRADIETLLTEIIQGRGLRVDSDGYWDFSSFTNRVPSMAFLRIKGRPFKSDDYLLVSLAGQQTVLCGDERDKYIQDYYVSETIARPKMKPIEIIHPQTSYGVGYYPPVFVISACATYLTDSAEGYSSDIITYPEVIFGLNGVVLDVEPPIPDYVTRIRYYMTWGIAGYFDANVAIRDYGIYWGSLNLPYSILRLAGEVRL